MTPNYNRHYDFSEPLDDNWEAIPDTGWTWEMAPGIARLANAKHQRAEIFLRPCSIYGDTLEFEFSRGAARSGIFVAGFLAGFEYVHMELDLTSRDLKILTHEFHKAQPRFMGKAPAEFSNLKIRREQDALPGLPYEGSSVTIVMDDKEVARVGEIDFLPESLMSFGLKSRGEFTLSSVTVSGPQRPRPEYVNVGLWQQNIKPTTRENVEALLEGVRQAAVAGVEILVTPETSLVGLRPDHVEWSDKAHIQAELNRFRRGVAEIQNAPYTLIGYPDFIPGAEVEGATVDEVMVNCHRFVRPDGTLGPPMAKVHVCEYGMWHGRNYNCQRVRGVVVAMGVCHDAHYPDIWATGVMAGARLCLHPSSGGNLSGSIPGVVSSFRKLGTQFDSFWLRVNAGGGAAIVYPCSNRKQPETILALPRDLTEESPTYPEYSPMGDLLAHARIRLWDATGCYPLRTLRSGKKRYELWKQLMPEVVDV